MILSWRPMTDEDVEWVNNPTKNPYEKQTKEPKEGN